MTARQKQSEFVERAMELVGDACEASWAAGENQIHWERHAIKRNAALSRLTDHLESHAQQQAAVVGAATAVLRDALDSVEVHPCDVDDDSVRAKSLYGSMRALYDALALVKEAK